jgi:hypothetical protein
MAHHHGSGGDHAHAENYSARALIVHTDAEMHGTEVEISPAERDHSRTHKDVLERSINGRAAYTAVFDRLTQGEYTLWVGDMARARKVMITGGEIAELDWTTAPGTTRGLATSGGSPLS